MSATAAFRGSLATVAHASATLARTLETCSRLKGLSDEAAVGLQAAGGLHHVIANHEQVLVSTYCHSTRTRRSIESTPIHCLHMQGRALHDHVEVPMKQYLDTYKLSVAERSAAYERTLIERSRVIRQTEKESLMTGRRRQRGMHNTSMSIPDALL